MSRLDPDLCALQDVRDCVARARAAQAALARFSQSEVDRLCQAVADAGAAAAKDLARLAVEETGIGRLHYKVLKTLFGTKGTWESIRNVKTVGIIERDEKRGLVEVATPIGVIACIVPTTNPTSTAFFKSLVSLKGRNAAVISPHPRARRTIAECVSIARDAIERVGGPPEVLQVLTNPTIESTGALMKSPGVDLILATGGTGLVKAAYSSGKPAYGVGPGNVPCYVDRSADIEAAARWIIASQSFDNATFCCSEQALVVDRPVLQPLMQAMARRGAHLCSEEETRKLERYCIRDGHQNPEVVGLDPWRIAEGAGFRVPHHTSLLLAPQNGVGPGAPLSVEILCPLLSLHVVEDWEAGCDISLKTLHADGLGHTISIWARDQRVLEAWMLEKPASRIIVNGPSSQGAVGYSTNLAVSVSLGCGPQAGNITSENITAKHLVNIKRVAFLRTDWEQIDRRDHALAAQLSGESAPRGSGLPGDPALGHQDRGPLLTPSAQSNWRGNPPLDTSALGRSPVAAPPASYPANSPTPAPSGPRAQAGPQTTAQGGLGSKVSAASKAAPRFTEPKAGPLRADAAIGVRATVAPSVAPFRPGDSARAGTSLPEGSRSTGVPEVTRSVGPRSAGPYAGQGLSADDIESILAHAGSGCPMGPCQGCPHHDVQGGACLA